MWQNLVTNLLSLLEVLLEKGGLVTVLIRAPQLYVGPDTGTRGGK